METSTVLTILGIFLTAILGSWGLYATFKNYKPGEITFIKEEFIPLFDSIVKNLSDLQITYLNEPVKPNLYLIKGALLNTGKKDISNDMVEDNIKIELPANYKWVTAKVISKAKNVKADANINIDTELEFEFGLFRTNEYVRFQALYEKSSDETKDEVGEEIFVKKGKKSKRANFSHRIKDVKDIKIKTVTSEDKSKNDLKGSLFILLGGIVFAIFMASISVFLPSQQDIIFKSLLNNDRVTIKEIKEDIVYYKKYKSNSEEDKLSIKFFNEDFIPTNELVYQREPIKTVYFLFIFFVGLPLLALGIQYSKHRKNMRLVKILFLND